MSRKSEELKAAEAAIRAFDFTQPIGCNKVLVYEFQSRHLDTEDCLSLIELCKEVTPKDSQTALALDFKSRNVPDYDTTRGEFSAPYYVTECSDYRIIAWKRSKEAIEREERMKAEVEAIKERAEAEGISHAEAMMKLAIKRNEEIFDSKSRGEQPPPSKAMPMKTWCSVKDLLTMLLNEIIERYSTCPKFSYSACVRVDPEETILFFSRVLKQYNIDRAFRQSLEIAFSERIRFFQRERDEVDFSPELAFYENTILVSDMPEIEECMEGLETMKELASYRRGRFRNTEKEKNNG